ncbi:hypothetical protein ACHAQD_010259 [Fusarium lateritium]
MNDRGKRLFASTRKIEALSATETAEFYLRFRTWFDQLPEPLSPRNVVLPSALKLHMRYYHELLGLLQPLAAVESSELASRTFTDLYLRHGFEYLDTYLLAFLNTCVFMSIEDIDGHSNPDNILEVRSTIILLCSGIYYQSNSLFLGQLLFRLVRSRIRAEDLEVLRHFAKFDDAILTAQEKHLWQAKSEWPVDIVSNVDDPDAKRLSLVLKQYKSEVSDELMSEASIL